MMTSPGGDLSTSCFRMPTSSFSAAWQSSSCLWWSLGPRPTGQTGCRWSNKISTSESHHLFHYWAVETDLSSYFGSFHGFSECNVRATDLYIQPDLSTIPKLGSVWCVSRKSLLESMSYGGRVGFDAPYSPRGTKQVKRRIRHPH